MHWEYVIPFLASVSLLISCIIVSSKKYYWNDELYSYFLLADPSFSHMWGSFQDKINNTPSVYFVLGWLWVQLFSASELSLRLFSSIGFVASLWITWFALRRYFSVVATAIGVLLPYCASTLVLYQNSEARMYGLYLTVCALGLLLYDRINQTENPGRFLWIANATIHAAFIHTHLHGIFFSGALLVAFLVNDYYHNRFRISVYLSIFLGWLTFLLYLPTFLVQADAGYPRTWLYLPSWRDLASTLTLFEYGSRQWLTPLPFNAKAWVKLAGVVVAVGVSLWLLIPQLRRKSAAIPSRTGVRREKSGVVSLLFLAYAYLAVIPAVWLISYLIKPVFMDRYLMPVLFSWTIILPFLVENSIAVLRNSVAQKANGLDQFVVVKAGPVFITLLIAFLLYRPIAYAKNRYTELMPGWADSQCEYTNLPIVFNYSNDFLKRLYYRTDRDRYFFVQHWPSAVDTTSGLFPPQEYKHLEALKRRYPDFFKNQIIQSDEFLKKHERFLVITQQNYRRKATSKPTIENVQQPQWFNQVIVNNPRYKVTVLGENDIYAIIHLVERK